MAGNELYVVAGIAIIAGYLMLRYRVAAARRDELAEARGLSYAERGLDHLPAELSSTVLFALADGIHESHVARGSVDLGGTEVEHSVFEAKTQRAIRGEWAYLTTTPAFRMDSPTTVFTYTLDRDLAHTLIKRRGASMLVAEGELEAYGSVVNLARDMSGIERAMRVDPPNDIDRTPVRFDDLAEQFFVWSADAEAARTMLSDDVRELLLSPAAGGKDLAIELCGPLMLLYCTSDGRLSRGDALAASSFADELCARVLQATEPSDTP